MADLTRKFIAGRMNKSFDQRVVPDGEYIDAMNVRMGSTEKSEIGVIENTKGNLPLTALQYNGIPLSSDARTIGALEDSSNERIFWFVHDPSFPIGVTGKLDLIVSYNVLTEILTYHIISIKDGEDETDTFTTLNFNPKYLITGVNYIDDLVFFTDNYNPPRFFNVNRNYPNPNFLGEDGFSAESILVIKRPPIEAPTVVQENIGNQANYMDTRFICFAYRYKYADGEYSATSQWSDIAFTPKPFNFSPSTYLNEGMTNSFNAAKVTFNSGSNLVVGIDLLFKQSNNNITKIIEKINKQEVGYLDNTNYSFVFSNSKIFTILPESELLRLYDNVPRYAQAQTLMGNRLMYGNYIEGYNLVDKFGNPLLLGYQTLLEYKTIGNEQLNTSLATGTYTINTSNVVPDSILNIDLSSIVSTTGGGLVSGSSIFISITLIHDSFTGDTPRPTETTGSLSLSFQFVLQRNYTSVHELAISSEFQDAIGTIVNIEPVISSCDGITFTDTLNCQLPNNLNSLIKDNSGVSGIGQPIKIISSVGSNIIGLQLISMQYVDNITTPTKFVYEYYKIIGKSAFFQKIASPRSLHSNRGYELGIVYMDEFNRSSTALVSPNNTVNTTCGDSVTQNSITVNIPVSQRAPYWAKRYKFVIKPDEEIYQTIYSNVFFQVPQTNEYWFLLEGENARKVEKGDRLIVKADSNGAIDNCAYATVLEKEAQTYDFIDGVTGIPAGTYIKINPNGFDVIKNPDSTIAPGRLSRNETDAYEYPILSYPMNIFRGAGYNPSFPLREYEDYDITNGTRIKIFWNPYRPGNSTGTCEKREYILNKEYISSADYSNMYDWFVGQNIASTINLGTQIVGGGACGITNIFNPSLGILSTGSYCNNYWQFYRDPVTYELKLMTSGAEVCVGFGDGKNSKVTMEVTVYRTGDTFIFETEPQDALPDVFFENNESYAIDSEGNHLGAIGDTDQNIALNQIGIIHTGFFNCFSFGNGAESYTVRDSIIGRPFNLGQRVTGVSAQDYKEAHRFADITYSGIYNTESNINKLNEFNLGLLNYKYLEASFGPIYRLDGRQTDVLTLQEDKISYVLVGKNLLSDAAGGGALTSVPEVLGTQIARTEKYGISFNPESYVKWGFDRFFTDVKRGVVIQLRGTAASNEELKVVSEMNMRTWFRDNFNEYFNTQKLGGFDPYMNEYVLCSNEQELPLNPECVQCGVTQTLTLTSSAETVFSYCVDLGGRIGSTDVSWDVTPLISGNFTVTVEYDGVSYTTPLQTTSGTYSFFKGNISVEIATITITAYNTPLAVSMLVECPFQEEMTIIQVVLNNNSEAGLSTTTQFNYTYGLYTSPLQSNPIVFLSGPITPVVSNYNVSTGFVGAGIFPPEFSTMRIANNQIFPDTYVFNPDDDSFRYLRSNTLYGPSTSEINALLAASTEATPIVNSLTSWYADFTVPDNSLGNILYLIWDYRKPTAINLCYSDAEAADPLLDSCCLCEPCNTPCITYLINNPSATETSEISFPGGLCETPNVGFNLELEPGESEMLSIYVEGYPVPFTVLSGEATVLTISCG
jgi:hypothetical protein